MRGIRSKAQSRRQVGWGERPKNTKRFGPKIIWGPADRLPHESLSLPGISIFLKRLAFAKPAPIRGVHLQKADRRSAYRGAPDNKDSVALEVLIPLVLPRMKEPDERAAFRVKSAQVRSLVRIAVVAGESEVSAVVSSAMLASDDVLDVIGEEWLRVLRQTAVFAAITGPFTDSLPEPLVHQAA
jgi:hypothetical protein